VSKIASILDVIQPAQQFLNDETREGSRNFSLLNIQPPVVAASLRKIYRLTDSSSV